MIPGLDIEAILNSLGSDAQVQDLFGGEDALRDARKARQVSSDARQTVAGAVLRTFSTPDGQRVLEYLVGGYIRRHEDITSMGLPMETAIQLHAAKDGAKTVVYDLLRLMQEGKNPPAAQQHEA